MVEDPADPYQEISLAEAQKVKKNAQLGDVIALEVTLYIFIVKRYPILGGVPATQTAQ